MQLLRRLVAAAFLASLASLSLAVFEPALADMAHNWQMGMQEPASPVASQINGLHQLVLDCQAGSLHPSGRNQSVR